MKKLVLLCGALALLALEVRAQTPEYTAKMTRMLELSGSDAVMKELPKQMIGMMKQQVPAMPDSVSRQIEDLMSGRTDRVLRKPAGEENGFDATVDFKGGDGRGAAVGRRIWQ